MRKNLIFFILLWITFLGEPGKSQSIILEGVSGLKNGTTDTLLAGTTPVFAFRIQSDSHYVAFKNVFKIYSNDGAQWTTVKPDTAALNWRRMFDYFFHMNSVSIDGFDEDTVGFNGISLYGDGFVTSFDHISFTLTIGPLAGGAVNHGKTICIDSVDDQQNNIWLWSLSDHTDIKPRWEGPYCYTIVDVATDIYTSDQTLPTSFQVYQNYPNPFNPKTTIQFELPEKSVVNLIVYNITGQTINEASSSFEAGIHQIEWDGSQYPSGLYFYKLKAGKYSETKKMILLK